MVEMAKRYIFPAVTASAEDYARAASALAVRRRPILASGAQGPQARRARRGRRRRVGEAGEGSSRAVQEIEEPLAEARAYRESVVPRMNALREKVDAVERIVEASRWPFPTYQDLLFSL